MGCRTRCVSGVSPGDRAQPANLCAAAAADGKPGGGPDSFRVFGIIGRMVSIIDSAAIGLRLGLLGYSIEDEGVSELAAGLVRPILARQRELARRLGYALPPVDNRIQSFLDAYFAGTDWASRLPNRTLVLDQPGLASEMSLPRGGDHFESEQLSSYRLANGVLHNPANDRRTTKGVFHIAEGGLPIQDDKIAVPRDVAARIFAAALCPPQDSLLLPYTADEPNPAHCWASLLLRPVVVPEVPGFTPRRTMEVRFFAPATLMANLHFVEGIFGNGGDPFLPECDAALDPESWTGHTGAVILAPHLTKLTKRELGLPHHDEATERQRRDGQCWTDPEERYNGGSAFKLCVRDERGVIATVIADNYFGYCKKEVKAQISYATNLLGLVEEEHSGGARTYPRYNLGQTFTATLTRGRTFVEALRLDPEWQRQPEGHATHARIARAVLVPDDAEFSLRDSTITWHADGEPRRITLKGDHTYLTADGYQVEPFHLEVDGAQWTLVGTLPVPTEAHKPATVSGGGKSEISKSITDAFIVGNAYVEDFDRDMAAVAAIVHRDFSQRFVDKTVVDHRPLLSDERSVGSVIKLLTPSADFTDYYNEWLEQIPNHVKELVFVVKRFYRPEWGEDWQSHFSVPSVNGRTGHALRLDGEKIRVNMLRVGYGPNDSWRLFGLRHDFHPAVKVQTEDDITASIVAPEGEWSRKYVENAERLLFQRPDDAIHRGYDKQTEQDIASGAFLSNFAPLTASDAQAICDDAVGFSQFTRPMRTLIKKVADGESRETYFVSSAHPRIVDGARSKNPRYLQVRPDIVNARTTQLAELSERMALGLTPEEPLRNSVDVVAAGRRNNVAEPGVPALCAYAPLHYMELPELMMEFISSMTGKSPSTTGAGSEGAMTKGPFNALPSVYDLNAAFLSFALTGYDGWLSSAGVVGPNLRVDHDISLLIPELFSRMSPAERNASSLIAEGALEPVPDFEHGGQVLAASRLGYRMTKRFTTKYFGRIFLHPHVVFSDEMLRPELQDAEAYASSVRTIVATHERVARSYFADGTIDYAIPPVRALLGVMANGEHEGMTLRSVELRNMFTRDAVLAANWYEERLSAATDNERALLGRSISAIEEFLAEPTNAEAAARLGLVGKLERLRAIEPDPARLRGTLGRQVRFS